MSFDLTKASGMVWSLRCDHCSGCFISTPDDIVVQNQVLFGTPIRGDKIKHPEPLGGDLDAEFHGDSEFHGPRAIGGQERGVIGGQRWNMEEIGHGRIPNFDPSEEGSKSNVQKC